MNAARASWPTRLRELLLAPLLPEVVHPRDDEDLARLDAHLAGQSLVFARFIMGWCIVVNAIWWPLDPITMGGLPRAVAAFNAFRVCVMVVSLLVLAVLRGRRALRGGLFAACVAVWCVEIAALAACMATLGDLATPWFHFLYTIVLATGLFPMRLPARLAFATSFAASLLADFLAARPSALRSPFLGSTVSYLSFSVVVAVAHGHRTYLFARQAYLQRLDLERSRAQITAQREHLRDEVDARTHELRRLADHLDRAGESERVRIARDLHDDLGQSVSALRFSLSTARRRFDRAPASIRANLDELDDLVRRVADDTRDTITRLRPRILEDRGLAAAAEWLVRSTERRGELACALRLEGLDAPRDAVDGEREAQGVDEVGAAAFRILQESLTNVVRHARATKVDVCLTADGARLTLRVDDDGVGIAAAAPSRSGMGLLGMRERARSLGGEFSVQPGPHGGTRLLCTLPLTPQREAT